jgi:predicted nucleic acid-binding protein
MLAALRALLGHTFWLDDISVMDVGHIDARRLLSHSQVTDSHLLALAHAHGWRLATLDSRWVVNAVVKGAKALEPL